jgi:TonB family protein
MTRHGRSRRWTWIIAACLLGAGLTPRPVRADDLASAVQLLEAGDLQAAVDALSAVVRTLSAQPGRAKDLARAQLYLGVAYALVDPPQERAAQASFREALKADATIVLPRDRYPAKVVRLFNSAREGMQGLSPPPEPSGPSSAQAVPSRGQRVGLINLETVAKQRTLRDHDPQQLRTIVEAVSRSAGLDIVLSQDFALPYAPVADVSRAVAARVEGAAPVAVPAGTGVRACVVDMQRLANETQLGRSYRAQVDELMRSQGQDKAQAQSLVFNTQFQEKARPHIDGVMRRQDCDLLLSAQVALALASGTDLSADVIVSLDKGAAPTAQARPAGRAEPTTLAVVDGRRLATDSTRARGWRAAAEAETAKGATTEAETARQAAVDVKLQAQVRPHLESVARSHGVDVLVTTDAALVIDPEVDLTGRIIAALDGALPSPPAPAPVRVGGQIKEPRKLKDVRPVYPDIARQARVQGVVILECVIGPDGTVMEVKVLRGIPLLDQAAIDAVRQWVYAPTLLNEVPVPVIMTVTVNFRLE